jgi:hypothetical protein
MAVAAGAVDDLEKIVAGLAIAHAGMVAGATELPGARPRSAAYSCPGAECDVAHAAGKSRPAAG